jgi:hypothetical protein
MKKTKAKRRGRPPGSKNKKTLRTAPWAGEPTPREQFTTDLKKLADAIETEAKVDWKLHAFETSTLQRWMTKLAFLDSAVRAAGSIPGNSPTELSFRRALLRAHSIQQFEVMREMVEATRNEDMDLIEGEIPIPEPLWEEMAGVVRHAKAEQTYEAAPEAHPQDLPRADVEVADDGLGFLDNMGRDNDGDVIQ